MFMEKQRKALSIKETALFVERNKYPVDENTSMMSRCIDGRYNRVEGLPALAIPGADAGQMCIIFSACRKGNLPFNPEKVFKALIEIVGRISNLRFHRDDHSKDQAHLSGCGYIGQISLDPKAFGLTQQDVKFVKEKVDFAIENRVEEVVLHGEHSEAAVLLLSGNYSVYPKDDSDPNEILQTFVFHQSLMEKRTRILAQKLIKNNAVQNISESKLYNLLVNNKRTFNRDSQETC